MNLKIITLLLVLFILSTGVSAQTFSTQPTSVSNQITPAPVFFWSEFIWNIIEENGITVTDYNQTLLIQGEGTISYWNNVGKIFKRTDSNSVQVEIALKDTNASASAAGIWLVKDNQNALIVEKHHDVIDPQYHSNVFIVEKINGINYFRYVSPDPPSADFDHYQIEKTTNGYTVSYNQTLIYNGTLNLNEHDQVELVGITRASGDKIEAKFESYEE
jgi:hypothetical protein